MLDYKGQSFIRNNFLDVMGAKLQSYFGPSLGILVLTIQTLSLIIFYEFALTDKLVLHNYIQTECNYEGVTELACTYHYTHVRKKMVLCFRA
jgi:hypothetical protein